MYSIESTNI